MRRMHGFWSIRPGKQQCGSRRGRNPEPGAVALCCDALANSCDERRQAAEESQACADFQHDRIGCRDADLRREAKHPRGELRQRTRFERTREYTRSIRRMREIAQELHGDLFTDIRTLRKDESPALQAADYLAFETYHWLFDRQSVRSVWGISIVGHGNTFADPATPEWLSQMVEHFRANGGGID